MDTEVDFLSHDFLREYAALTKEKLLQTLDAVSQILDREPKLIEIPCSKAYFLGDTHGNFHMTVHALRHLFPKVDSGHTPFDKTVFLGDFIDRGAYSIENVNLLMSMKAKYPNRVILIRGNHETREVNIRYGFYEAVIRRYGMKVFELYNRIFAKLPLAVLTWNNIFAVHGGVPEGLEHLNDLNGIEDEVSPEDKIAFQILWNDPVEKKGWFFKNFRGKYSQKFGQEAFKHFMTTHNIHLFLRAHEVQKGGYKEFFNANLISLDSSQAKRKKNNMKVFILEKSGDSRVAEVEFFEHLKLSDVFK